jgi:hypothetical protein
MSEFVTGFDTAAGVKKYDYEALGNLPQVPPAGYVQYEVGISTEGELDAATTTAFANVADGKIGYARFSLSSALSIPGGVWFVTICRSNDSYGYISAVRYGIGECRRYFTNGVWSEWEMDTPAMNPGSEYRTTERYKGVAVYKKVDNDGNILWRGENETSWHLLASAGAIAAATVE